MGPCKTWPDLDLNTVLLKHFTSPMLGYAGSWGKEAADHPKEAVWLWKKAGDTDAQLLGPWTYVDRHLLQCL